MGSAPLAQSALPAARTLLKPAIAERLLEYGPRSATARFQEKSTSLALSLSPLENVTFCFSLTV